MTGMAYGEVSKQKREKWWERLGKDSRGSRPRCVLLVDGDPSGVAKRLTQLVNCRDVTVSSSQEWMPRGKPLYRCGKWDDAPAKETDLINKNNLLSSGVQDDLRKWWLDVGATGTPKWDIASTCEIEGKRGLLLIEAKAHKKELTGKPGKPTNSPNSQRNHQKICRAIAEANAGLKSATGNPWHISRGSHYQLSNRFAWAWKLASLRVPVVLVYLGFLNAQDMENDGPLFRCYADWERALKTYGNDVVDNSCWGKRWNINGTTLIPLIRTIDQPFDPSAPEAPAPPDGET